MINKWGAKINEKGDIYCKKPSRKEKKILKRRKTVAVCIILENLCN